MRCLMNPDPEFMTPRPNLDPADGPGPDKTKQLLISTTCRTNNAPNTAPAQQQNVITADREGTLPTPLLWDPPLRNDLLLPATVIPHPANIYVHARIRIQGICTEEGTSYIQPKTATPGCFCANLTCKQLGIHIISDAPHTIHLVINDPIGEPYYIPIGTQPGTNIISWCSKTIFFPNRLGPNMPVIMNVTSESLSSDSLILMHQHGNDDQYHPSTDGNMHPIPITTLCDEEGVAFIPTIMTVTKAIPPLWCLSRLALGTSGVVEGGLGEKAELRQRLPAQLWDIRRVVIGHEVSNKWE